MLFHTLEFQILFIFTLILFIQFPNRRVLVLGIANAFFYGYTGIEYLLLFSAVAFITYWCAKMLTKTHSKLYLYIGLIINLGNLVFFKYMKFIAHNLFFVLRFPQMEMSHIFEQIILPVGISFYTFQLIAYLIDVYHRKIEPEQSFLTFWVFISFFGQLIAGPIMRGADFLPQIRQLSSNRINAKNIQIGMFYILMGLIKKVALADNLATTVDAYFTSYQTINGLDAWIGTYLFAFQIFFDFSAYCEIAVGIGKILGLDLDINFKTPYLSANPTEFWTRWHITLSRWIKDYIYIPLGGNRKGFLRSLIYIIIAMTLSGIWHGAAWTFVIWGMYHGLLSAFNKIYVKYFKPNLSQLFPNRIYRIICIFLMFNAAVIGWVLFRANSSGVAIVLLKKMFSFSGFKYALYPVYLKSIVQIISLYVLHILEYYLRRNLNVALERWERVPSLLKGAVITAIIVLIFITALPSESSFIYFQF